MAITQGHPGQPEAALPIAREEKPDMGRRRFLRLATGPDQKPPPPSVAAPDPAPLAEPAAPAPAVVIADHIRLCSRQGRLVLHRELGEEPLSLPEETIALALDDIAQQPDHADIVVLAGKEDRFYFSEQSMTRNYADILLRVAENDQARMLAEAVRFECRTYPRPYKIAMLGVQPYFLDDETIEAILNQIEKTDAYADIRRITALDGTPYLFSTASMTQDEAQGLCDYEIECMQSP